MVPDAGQRDERVSSFRLCGNRASPAAADFAGDGGTRLVVGFGEGFVGAFERDGRVAKLEYDGS